jgi:hypothetical protein
MVGPLLMRSVYFFSREVGADVPRNFFSAENVLGSRLRLKSKKDESQDYNQDQEKGMGREDYSRKVRFFGGRLFSSPGVSPCPPWLWGFFLEEEGKRE